MGESCAVGRRRARARARGVGANRAERRERDDRAKEKERASGERHARKKKRWAHAAALGAPCVDIGEPAGTSKAIEMMAGNK